MTGHFLAGPGNEARARLVDIAGVLCAQHPDFPRAIDLAERLVAEAAKDAEWVNTPEPWLALAIVMVLRARDSNVAAANGQEAAGDYFSRVAVMCAGFARMTPNPAQRAIKSAHAQQVTLACAENIIKQARAAIEASTRPGGAR